MKKMIVVLLAAFFVMYFTACKETPENPLVVNKNLSNLEELASGEPKTKTGTLREQLHIPETLTAEFSNEGTHITIHTDAKITVPDTSAIPTARVGIGAFTEQDVENLYIALCGDAPAIPNDAPTTQADYLRMIEDLIRQRKEGVLDKYGSLEEIDAAIEELKQEMALAPAEYERIAPDFSFETQYEDGTREAHLRTSPSDGVISDLCVLDAGTNIGMSRAEYYRDLYEYASLSELKSPPSGYRSIPEGFVPAVDEQTARKTADDVISALGLSDFVCSASRLRPVYPAASAAKEPNDVVHEFCYTRSFNGIPLTFTNHEGGSVPDDGEGSIDYMIYPWVYETVRIFIDDEGVLMLLWNSPYAVDEIVTENTLLLDFSDIQQIYEKMAPIAAADEYSFFLSEDASWTFDVYITEIRLGLARVTEKDAGQSGLIIPVWDFFGYTEISGMDEAAARVRDAYESEFTINAIDGSVIDRRFGY